MNDKDLETKIYNYFDNEVPQPNQQILDELKIKMHQRTNSSTKRSFKKIHMALVSCIVIILLIPIITLPFMWDNFFPSESEIPSEPEEEVHYSNSNLTMVDLTIESLNNILVGEFSKYATLLEDYTINLARGYYAENNLLIYLHTDILKKTIPFTNVKLDIVFVENYEHEFDEHFGEITEFIQYEDFKLYETIFTTEYSKEYYKFLKFEDYKVYIQLDKKDSSIINTLDQN